MTDYMDNCIHIKACRRVQKIGKSKGHSFGRHCAENCTAYTDEQEVIKEIQDAVDWALQRGRDGSDYVRLTDTKRIVEWLKGGADD